MYTMQEKFSKQYEHKKEHNDVLQIMLFINNNFVVKPHTKQLKDKIFYNKAI